MNEEVMVVETAQLAPMFRGRSFDLIRPGERTSRPLMRGVSRAVARPSGRDVRSPLAHDCDRLPPRGDRVVDRLRPFDHDLVCVLADGFAHALEERILTAGDRFHYNPRPG